MRIIYSYMLVTVALAAAFASCRKEADRHSPQVGSGAVPQKVSNVQVVNTPGGAAISYTIPKDTVLLYVKAVYKLGNGRQAETKASYFSNSLLIEGMADTLEHEVTLYSVSRSEVQSEPTVVKIKPLEPPILRVFKSLQVTTAFGGFNLTASNATRDDIVVNVLGKNVYGEYEVDINKSVYTNADTIIAKIRGLDTLEYRYGFTISDKWGNVTDTLFKTFRPLYEAEFSKANFSALVLPGDAPQVTNGAALPYAWDNKLGWPNTSFTHQVNGGDKPHMITFNLGTTGKISRIWIRPFPEGDRYYYLTTMKRFEIYGSASPSLSGELDNSWHLLGSYEVVKPSGTPYGSDSNTDQATAAAGFNWEVDLNAPKVQYIRIRCLENFAGGTAQSINELSVYGDPR